MSETQRIGFTTERDTLKDALAWAGRSIIKAARQPVYTGVLINVTRQGVTLTGFDGFNSASTIIEPTAVGAEGSMLVSHTQLTSIVATLPATKPVTIVVEGSAALINAGRSKFTLNTMPLEDYPDTPEQPPAIGSADGGVLSEHIARVAVAASKDDTLGFLTGVYMEFQPDGLKLSGTDRYRLAYDTAPWQPTMEDHTGSALVKADKLAALVKAMATAGQVHVGWSADGGVLGLHTANRSATLSIMDSTYPNILRLFPAETPMWVVVDTAEFREAARRTALPVDELGGIIVHAEGDTLTLTGSSELGEVATESMDAEVEGGPFTAKFQPRVLVPALDSQPFQRVRLGLTAPTKPALLNGVTTDGELDPVYLHLIMPAHDPRGAR